MDLSTRSHSLLVASIALSILSYIKCGSIGNIDVTTPCKDVSEAINRLYKALPDQMPIEARCRRYAVFLSMADTSGATHELALLQLSLLREELLDWLYGEINTADLATLYMTAIDAYLATRLEPAFIDLIECLRDIHTTAIKTYLDNTVLKTVEELYRRVLASPADGIDLESVDLRGFHPGFRATLQKLFEGHSDIPDENPGQIDLFNQLSSSYLAQKSRAEQFIEQTERLMRIRLKRRRHDRVGKRHSPLTREIDHSSKRQETEPIRQQLPSIGHELPETIEDPRLERLARRWKLRRGAQRRYRERNLERLRAVDRDRHRERRRQLAEQKNMIMKSHEDEVPTSISELSQDRHRPARQGSSEMLPSTAPDPSASIPIATISEPPFLGQRGLAPSLELQAKEQASEEQLWLERLDRLEKAADRRRERERKYRAQNTPFVRTRDRERKRRWRQQVRRQHQKHGNSLLDYLDGTAESTDSSKSGQDDHR